MTKVWDDKMWEHYLYWQSADKRTLNKINTLIKDIERNGVNVGIGKPERLKYLKAWSREIDEKNRLTYDIINDQLILYTCRGHYDDK
ncbi:MAG: Txe/YoeB family addiction module toxin [Defluviitaleaceae bacterium]|nr:Txe/YoeB family addiction module toxin [Defluviitaleaceae bacterium]